MAYLLVFLEGIITFVSPCLLPMIPLYVGYFAGGEAAAPRKTLVNALCFVLGFTSVFLVLGAFAGTLGSLLTRQSFWFNLITGGIVVIFGLNYTGLLKIGILNRSFVKNADTRQLNGFSAFLFGVIFSIGWTPCVGAFLGSALLLASQQGSAAEGIFMLLLFSLGMGIPFVLSAVIIDRLKGAFTFIKTHYQVINLVSGIFLILIGILMMTGKMSYWLGLFSA